MRAAPGSIDRYRPVAWPCANGKFSSLLLILMMISKAAQGWIGGVNTGERGPAGSAARCTRVYLIFPVKEIRDLGRENLSGAVLLPSPQKSTHATAAERSYLDRPGRRHLKQRGADDSLTTAR